MWSAPQPERSGPSRGPLRATRNRADLEHEGAQKLTLKLLLHLY